MIENKHKKINIKNAQTFEHKAKWQQNQLKAW